MSEQDVTASAEDFASAFTSATDENSDIRALTSEVGQESEKTLESTEAKPSRARDRIQQLIREKHAAEALAQRSMSEAAALRERLYQTGRPTDYRAPEDFTRAVAENAVREVGADMLSRQANQAQELALRVSQEAWTEATADFRQKVPDFDEVAHNPNLAVTPVMADAIRESERGAEIAYYLGKNPAEAAKIAALAPVSQAIAIARLEGRIGMSSSSVSRAPQPHTTLSGRSGSVGKPLEDMNFEEYRRARGF